MTSYEFSSHGNKVCLRRRVFHGVERAEYSDLETLTIAQAENLRVDLDNAIAVAQRQKLADAEAARATASLNLEAARAEVARLEAEMAADLKKMRAL